MTKEKGKIQADADEPADGCLTGVRGDTDGAICAHCPAEDDS